MIACGLGIAKGVKRVSVMPIIRTPKPDSYTLINNSVFSDSEPLSWDAMGLLCYLLSKPDNWTVSPAALANTQRCGINKIHGLLNELKQSGFVIGKKNKNGKYDYYVFDTKRSETSDLKPNHEKPNHEKPDKEKPNQDLDRQLNTEYKQILKEEVNTELFSVVLGETENSKNNQVLKWVEYFVNKHGFAFHEAQTAKTVPMFIRWNESNVTVEDVELAILAAHGWLSKKGESKATSPSLYDKFLKTVLAEKQQAQKNPLEGNQAGFQSVNTTKVINYEDYSRKSNTKKLSTADRQLYSVIRGEYYDKYERGEIDRTTYEWAMREYAS